MSYEMTQLPEFVYRVCWGDNPLSLAPMDRIRKSPGRFDDPKFEYRVHYTAETMVGAYIEVMAGLRPETSAMADYSAIDGDDDLRPMEQAIDELLETRSASLLIVPHRDELVDLTAARSRSQMEIHLGVANLKGGDFTASDYALSRAASRVLFEANRAGLAIGSAEAGVDYRFNCYSVFEQSPGVENLRVDFVPRSITPALQEHIALREAIERLGLLN